MSSLFHVKISDLSTVNAIKNSEKLLNSDLVLCSYKGNNYKSTLNDLSTYIENKVLNSNSYINGQWTFKKNPRTTYIGLSKKILNDSVTSDYELSSIVTKQDVDDIYNDFHKKLSELSTYLFENPFISTSIGTTIITEISSEVQLINIYGGNMWEKVCEGFFVVGAADTDDNYKLFEVNNPANNSVRLTSFQVAMPSHNHTTASCSVKSSKVTFMGYREFTPGSQNFGKHGHKNFASHISTPIRGSCGTSVTVSVSSISEISGQDAKTSFDNRPEYQCLYIWRRVA